MIITSKPNCEEGLKRQNLNDLQVKSGYVAEELIFAGFKRRVGETVSMSLLVDTEGWLQVPCGVQVGLCSAQK